MSWHTKHIDGVELEIPMPEIVGKQRPRSTHAGGVFRTYTPKRTQVAEQVIRSAWIKEFGGDYAGFTGEVWMCITATRELAKSNPKHWEGRTDTMKPDADNIAKLVLDALNGVAFADDSQVTRLEIIKRPRVAHGCGCLIGLEVGYYEESEH